MTKNPFSFSRKNETSLHGSPKEGESEVATAHSPESNSPNAEVAIPSWCANPERCLTDCKEYCEKLHSDAGTQDVAVHDVKLQDVAVPSWCVNPESCLSDCKEYCEKLHLDSSR